MLKLCRACDSPVCNVCGGCISEGECSCVDEQVEKKIAERLAPFKALLMDYYSEVAIGEQIANCSPEESEKWEQGVRALQKRAEVLLPELSDRDDQLEEDGLNQPMIQIGNPYPDYFPDGTFWK